MIAGWHNHMLHLVKYAQSSTALTSRNKLKLILLAGGIKRAAAIMLRISPKNLGEKYRFEEHLKKAGLLYIAGKARGFEEINTVKESTVYWKASGVWILYELFCDANALAEFQKYKKLLKQNTTHADVLAAELYGYPTCCAREYSRQRDMKYIARNFSYKEYYTELHAAEQEFPFVFHAPCKRTCSASKKLNEEYARAAATLAPRFFASFTKKETYITEVVVDGESDMLGTNAKTIWPYRTAHEYTLITRKKLDKNHYLLPYLTNTTILSGAVFNAKVIVKHDAAQIKLGTYVKQLQPVVHKRRLLL